MQDDPASELMRKRLVELRAALVELNSGLSEVSEALQEVALRSGGKACQAAREQADEIIRRLRR